MINVVVSFSIIYLCVTTVLAADPYEHNVFESPNASPPVLLVPEETKPHQNLSGVEGFKLYRWIARVIPTDKMNQPTKCTAAAIKPKIFVSAARCLIGLTVGMAHLVYDQACIKIKAMVVADKHKHSKQYFDDLGLIVAFADNYLGNWPTVKLFDLTNRTDENFDWFMKLNYDELKERQHRIISFKVRYSDVAKSFSPRLYQADVYVGIDFCFNLLSAENGVPAYRVPCASFCPPDCLLMINCKKCDSYIKNDGSLIYDFKSNFLLGAVTWGTLHLSNQDYNPPVGFSVPNSKSFFEVLECAEVLARVSDDRPHEKGYFQKLCD